MATRAYPDGGGRGCCWTAYPSEPKALEASGWRPELDSASAVARAAREVFAALLLWEGDHVGSEKHWSGAPEDPDLWAVTATRRVFDSPWVAIDLMDVTPPGGEPYAHHVVRLPDAVGVVVEDRRGRVLMINRHRFITGTTGLEIPAGGLAEGEAAQDGAARELREETGWEVSGARHFHTVNVSAGATDQRFLFVYCRAEEKAAGAPVDAHEASTLYWVPGAELEGQIRDGAIPGVLSISGVLLARSYGLLGSQW